MSNFEKILIIVLLCIAVVFVSGILLPKYLSSQILELRNELKSQNIDSKYSLKANSVPDAQKRTQNESKSFMPSLNVGTNEFPSQLPNNTNQLRAKRKKRSKRQAVSSKRRFTWNFNFNLTEQRNPAMQETSENKSDASDNDKHLDIALYNKGEANEKEAFGDIKFTLKLAEWYFKEAFKRIENITDEKEMEHGLVHLESDFASLDAGGNGDELHVKRREGKFFDLSSLNIFGFGKSPQKSIPSTVSTVLETDSVFSKDELTRTTQLPQTGILTESSQKVPNFQAKSLVSEVSSSVSNVSLSNLPGKTENGDAIEFEASSIVDNVSLSNLPGKTKDGDCLECNTIEFKASSSEGNVSLSNLPGKTEDGDCLDCDAIELKASSSEGNVSLSNLPGKTEDGDCIDCNAIEFEASSSVNNVSLSNLPGKTEDGNCIDCNAVEFESAITNTDDLIKDVSETGNKSTEFTNEFLEMFCMRLVNAVGTSQHLSDTEEKVEHKQNILNISKSTENPVSDSFQNSVPEREFNLDHVTEGIPIIRDSSASANELKERFLDLGSLGGLFENVFGSGRAAEDQDGSHDLTSGEFADAIDLQNLPTILDCENFFRKEKGLTMFPKPNLMDMMRDPNIQLEDFANTTESSKLIEHRIQILSDILKTNLDVSVNRFVKVSAGAVTKSTFDEIAFESEGPSTNEIQKDIFVQTEPNDLNSNTEILLSNTDLSENFYDCDDYGCDYENSTGGEVLPFVTNDVLQTTESQRDSRLIGMFGFGSGNGDSRALATEDLNIDGNEIVGIGDERSFVSSLFGNRNELGSGDSRSLIDTSFSIEKNESGGGDAFKENYSELNDDLQLNKERHFGLLGLLGGIVGGSGGGRDLPEETAFKETYSELNEDLQPNKERLFGLLGGLLGGIVGSGGGRDLAEETIAEDFYDCDDYGCDYENSTGSEVLPAENNCKNNCSSETITEDFYDCDDYGCDIDNSTSLLEDQDLKVERGCHEDCSNVSVDTSNETEENIVLGQIRINKNLTAEILSEMNRSTIEENEFSVCDECNHSNSNSNESEEILPSEEVIINTNQERADGSPKTGSNTSKADASSNRIDVESTDSSNVQNVESPHNKTDENSQRFFETIFLTGSGDGGLFGDSGGPINLLEEDPINEEGSDSKARNIIKKPLAEQTTERNDERFLRPIFLTGSGDGGLFEDSGGPINLVEEDESKGRSQNISLRQARFDDFPLNISANETFKQSKEGHSVDNNTANEKFTSPITPIRRRGRVDDMLDKDYADFIENYRLQLQNMDHNISNKDASNFEKRIITQSEKELPLTNESKNTVTASSDIIQKNTILVDFTKKINFRPCTAARECDVTLNERCIRINSSRVCGCSRGYARNKETGKCIVKKVVETSIKLPAESFEDDLKNPFSPSFQRKKQSSVEMVMLLLQNNPDLLRMLSDIEVVKFSAGSLVITLNLVFAVENESEAQLVKYVEDDLQVSLRDEKVMKSVSLDISEAALLSVNGEIDYCRSSELNYCSENAYCVSNPALPGSYACHCKEHFRDVSFDPQRIGETCLAKCPQEYCGAYGHCELLANDEKVCLCSGLYFGRRCEVPGLYVLIILGLVVFVSLTMLVLVIFKRRCSSFSYRESDGSETNGAHANGRVSDAIALEENIGTTRFMSISTPIPHPAIKVTRATITESGSSYDYDSTFDSTPSVQKSEASSTV